MSSEKHLMSSDLMQAITVLLDEITEKLKKDKGDIMSLRDLQKIVDEQAEDDGLWFEAVIVTEAYLQQELRKLHKAIEKETTDNYNHLYYFKRQALDNLK